MKNIFKVFVFLIPMVSFGQSSFEEIIKSNQEFQMQMNKDYADEKHSPLKEEDRLNFKSLPFFEIDTSFCVNAKFEKDKKLDFESSEAYVNAITGVLIMIKKYMLLPCY